MAKRKMVALAGKKHKHREGGITIQFDNYGKFETSDPAVMKILVAKNHRHWEIISDEDMEELEKKRKIQAEVNLSLEEKQQLIAEKTEYLDALKKQINASELTLAEIIAKTGQANKELANIEQKIKTLTKPATKKK